MRRQLALAAGALILASCTTLSPAGSKVVDSDEAMVSGCQFLGSVQGSSGLGALAAKAGMRNAKNEVLEKAAGLGATHAIVSVVGGFAPSAQGRAYRCEPKAAQ